MSGGHPLGWTLSDLRAVHTRAAGIMDQLQETKGNHHLGAYAYTQKEWQKAEDNSQKKYGRPFKFGPEWFNQFWPKEWTAEQQRALEDATAVVRQLDAYAVPKKQRFGGVAKP